LVNVPTYDTLQKCILSNFVTKRLGNIINTLFAKYQILATLTISRSEKTSNRRIVNVSFPCRIRRTRKIVTYRVLNTLFKITRSSFKWIPVWCIDIIMRWSRIWHLLLYYKYKKLLDALQLFFDILYHKMVHILQTTY